MMCRNSYVYCDFFNHISILSLHTLIYYVIICIHQLSNEFYIGLMEGPIGLHDLIEVIFMNNELNEAQEYLLEIMDNLKKQRSK